MSKSNLENNPLKHHTGVFCGTFDMFHQGHRAMADAALREAGLKQLIIVPAYQPPNKMARELTPFEHRLAMVTLACQDDSRLVVSDIEAHLPTPSYTLHTLEALFPDWMELPSHFVAFLTGLDTFITLPSWHRPTVLAQKLHWLVVPRQDDHVPTSMRLEGQEVSLSVQVIRGFRDDSLASTQLRQECAMSPQVQSVSNGLDDYKLHPDVLAYIRSHQLYQYKAYKN